MSPEFPQMSVGIPGFMHDLHEDELNHYLYELFLNDRIEHDILCMSEGHGQGEIHQQHSFTPNFNNMLKPLSEEEASRIVKNILEACKDIQHLSRDGYRWISLRAGFIAHYNREGFISDYQLSSNLRDNILAYEKANTFCHRKERDRDYPYYQQVCRMYAEIAAKLKEHPELYRQKRSTDDFHIEFILLPSDNLHQIRLFMKKELVKKEDSSEKEKIPDFERFREDISDIFPDGDLKDLPA